MHKRIRIRIIIRISSLFIFGSWYFPYPNTHTCIWIPSFMDSPILTNWKGPFPLKVHYTLSEKSLATLDCFSHYLVNVERLDVCSKYLETTFISEEFGIKSVVADDEHRGHIYGKGTLRKLHLHAVLRSVHTKQLVAAIFVAATNLPVCTSLQHVSCNFQKLHATVSRFRTLLYFLQLVAADLSSFSSSFQISQSDNSMICW